MNWRDAWRVLLGRAKVERRVFVVMVQGDGEHTRFLRYAEVPVLHMEALSNYAGHMKLDAPNGAYWSVWVQQ